MQQPAPESKPNILSSCPTNRRFEHQCVQPRHDGLSARRTLRIGVADEGRRYRLPVSNPPPPATPFVTGQSPMRTGLLKVGLPGAEEGLSEKDPTLADLLKPQGYATGRFREESSWATVDDFLPTVHGFDEFFGNLYHLNAEDEPRTRTIRRTRHFWLAWPRAGCCMA